MPPSPPADKATARGVDAVVNNQARLARHVQAVEGSELTALKPYGSAHLRPGLAITLLTADLLKRLG
jgi:hypothetical protein